MDSFMSFNSQETEEEERLYCSAPHSEEDIIWAGSDAEHSTEEIERKRRRYEYHAERYLRGQLPVLQSASLKGPFAQDWVNPWRYHQRRKFPDWWKPGSEDMLFTRVNVMKRAADHGMGHLKPTEALAWCKAEAEAEADAEEQREASIESTSSNSNSNAGSDPEPDMEDEGPLPNPCLQNDGSGDIRMDDPTRLDLPNGPFSTSGRHIGTVDEDPESRRRLTKRPADSQWLKGSYVSKRARWDAPAMSSPTPKPDFHTERDRRQGHGSTRTPTFRDERPPMSNPKTPWSHEAQRLDPFDPFSESTTHGGKHLSNLNGTLCPPRYSYSTGQPYTDGKGISNHQGEDRPYQDSQESTFVSATTHIEERKLQNQPYTSRNPSFSHLSPEPDDISIPVVDSNLIAMNGNVQSNSSKTNHLPTLPQPYTGSNPESPEDISFVTEIAPSSRNLEQFQYKKKRRRSERQEYTGSNDDRPDQMEVQMEQMEMIHCSSSKSVESRVDDPSDITSETLHEQAVESTFDSDMPEAQLDISIDAIISQLKAPSVHAGSPIPTRLSETTAIPVEDVCEDDAAPRESDSSWDMIDDIDIPEINVSACGSETVKGVLQQPSSNSDEVQRASLPAQKRSVDEESRSSQIESVTIRLSQASPVSNEVLKDLAAQKTIGSFHLPNIADESTQSYNTTPMSSLRSLYKRTPASIKHPLSTEKTIGPEELLEGAAPLAQDLQTIAGNPVPYVEPETPFPDGIQPQSEEMVEIASEVASHQDEIDPMQTIQCALSQECGITSTTSSQSASNDPNFLPHESLREEEAVAQTNARVNSPHSPQNENHASWQRDAPQSPWATATIDPITIHAPQNIAESGRFDTPESEEPEPEESAEIATPASQGERADDSDWQRVEPPPITPEHDGIKPFKDFMTPTPSPEPPEPKSPEDGLSNTQQIFEAVVNNPWTSSFRNPASGKSKKRVSFGVLPSEELENSQLNASSSKQVPGSPPLQRSVQHIRQGDVFDAGTTTVSKFEKHFMNVGGVRRILSEASNSQFHETSPAVGAMAEAFIAADRDTSMEHDHRHASPESPSRHLRPVSQAKANRNSFDIDRQSIPTTASRRQSRETASNPRTIDYDTGDDLDDFIGGAGGFLEEWSVEAELRKAEPPKSAKSSRDSDGRRSMFGFTSRW